MVRISFAHSMIMVDKLFDVLLDLVCQYFIEDFCINVHQGSHRSPQVAHLTSSRSSSQVQRRLSQLQASPLLSAEVKDIEGEPYRLLISTGDVLARGETYGKARDRGEVISQVVIVKSCVHKGKVIDRSTILIS